MVPSRQQARAWARGLGWFGIALGSAELLFGGGRGGLRASGLREIVNGVGLLRSEDPVPWMWARVAGDAVDLAALTGAAWRGRTEGGTVAVLGAAAGVAGVMALDLLVARRLTGTPATGLPDYSRRSGLPLPAEEMRGAARADFETPADLRTPVALRPWPIKG